MIGNTHGTDVPDIKTEKISEDESDKRLLYKNYYSMLPLKIKDGEIYNVPLANAMFGGGEIIEDEESPYLFLPLVYYLNPKTLTPRFETKKGNQHTKISSKSTDKQARYTGLLVNDKEANALQKVLVHGIGIQGLYQRNNNVMITTIYTKRREKHLVVCDIIPI